jgi:hypothetical protein
MNNIITFIRKHKTTSVNDLLPKLQDYDKKITSKSIHLALVALFKSHHKNLNTKRLYELMRFINKKFSELPPTSNVEMCLSKIRQVVKAGYGENSTEYKKSNIHLVFDIIQKKINMDAYGAKVFQRNSNCQPIKISLINKLLAFKTSNDYREKIVYLLIDSGARFSELFHGVWDIDPDNEHNVVMSNISKTRDKKRKISRPLLSKDPNTFLKILEEIKGMNQDSTLHSVNAFLQKEIGESSYFLRKIFASMAYFVLDDPSVAKTVYLSKILGHNPNDESTALIYQGFYMIDDAPFSFATIKNECA